MRRADAPRRVRGRRARQIALLSTLAATALASWLGCRADQSAPRMEQQAERRSPRPEPRQIRAVWVARFHYQTPDDIATIMRNSAQLGFNTVLWQVRGDGTVLYPSRHEPWAPQYDFEHPGFDPLAIAVREARRHDLRIEAWINVMPGWRGPDPPTSRAQLWNKHPDWFIQDERGQRQPLRQRDPATGRMNPFYVIVNPALPEVRRHLCDLVAEIVRQYDVDGIHLDYIRYAWDNTPNAHSRYPRDARTISMFERDTGLAPDDSPAAWDSWRANQITKLVREIRETLHTIDRRLTLSAATWGDPVVGMENYLQNAVGWAQVGLLDTVYPMAYRASLDDFLANISAYLDARPQARIVPGLGAYKFEQPTVFAAQLQEALGRANGFAIFSYDSLRATAGDRGTTGTGAWREKQQDRTMRRDVLREFVRPGTN